MHLRSVSVELRYLRISVALNDVTGILLCCRLLRLVELTVHLLLADNLWPLENEWAAMNSHIHLTRLFSGFPFCQIGVHLFARSQRMSVDSTGVDPIANLLCLPFVSIAS